MIVGLDLGTAFTTIVVVDVDDERLSVVGVGRVPTVGLRKGGVINIDAAASSIAKATQQAQTISGRKIDSVVATVSGMHVKGFNSHGVVPVKNKTVTQRDVERVLEAARAVAIPGDREIIHILPQEYIVDDQDGIVEPRGMSGIRLESRAHIVTSMITSAQNIVKSARLAGLSVSSVVASPVAASQAVLTKEERELGALVLDLGAGTTSLTVVHGGAIRHTAVLAVGGSYVTGDIAAGLRTPLLSAEELKLKYGIARPTMCSRDETIEVPLVGGGSRIVYRSLLGTIIEPRVQEIIQLADRELKRSGFQRQLAAGVVISGGGANLRGITEVVSNVFQMPAKVGAPLGLTGFVETMNAPELATAAGVASFVHLAVQGAKPAISGNRLGQAVRAVNSWFQEHF